MRRLDPTELMLVATSFGVVDLQMPIGGPVSMMA